MAEDNLLVEQDSGVLSLTLNRPDALNAMSMAMSARLRDTLALAARDPRVRVVTITGAGRAFCAGGDLKARGSADASDPLATDLGDDPVWNSPELRQGRMMDGARSVLQLHTMPKPTVAIVNGLAFGAGFAPALACDLRYMAESAWINLAYADQALSGTSGLAWLLTQVVGTARARELMFFPRRIPATEALELGLVHHVVPDEELRTVAMEAVRKLADGPTVAYGHIKENLNTALTGDMHRTIEMEARNYVLCHQTRDYPEAMAALKDKRKPVFNGR